MNARPQQFAFQFGNELIVDLFAGGGGASWAIEQAFGRKVDIAVNHDETAVAVHAANHPDSTHFCEDVFAVDPVAATRGRQVGLLHASPDCTHHSQARGGQPRSKIIRALSWVVLKWAGRVRPRVITLENVEQIVQWAPLVAKRDRAGRVVRLDGTSAARGERVPVDQQFLVPCRRRRGRNWDRFVGALRAMGYAVQWRKLRACDYGAGTTRERLFMVARCDGEPIVWPKPSHGKKGSRLAPFVNAADCIDWTIPCPSIFGRKKPLADATMRRIAKGVRRFVLDAADPFIVRTGQTGGNGAYSNGTGEPLTTITSKAEHCLVAPVLVPRYGERPTQEPRALRADAPMPTIVPTGNGGSLAVASIVPVNHGGDSRVHAATEPLRTITGGSRGEHAAMVAYIEQANGGPNGHAAKDRDAREPLSTIIGKGSTQRVVTAHLAAFAQNDAGQRPSEPIKTVMPGSNRHAVVECTLSPEQEAGAERVAAFLLRYYSTGGQWGDVAEPVAAITARARLALVTVTIKGEPYVIIDIGLRMLQPDELKRCQGFPDSYVLDRRADGKAVTKTAQVKLIGNSVSPPPYIALLKVNVGKLVARELEAMRA